MARGGGVRRSRCDENVAGKAEEEAVKRSKADVPSPPEVGNEPTRSSRGRRKKARKGKKTQSTAATVLHPLNVNFNGLILEPKLEDPAGERKTDQTATLVGNAEECSSSSCTQSPETASADRTVIWSNAAFCSDQVSTRMPGKSSAPDSKGTLAHEVLQQSPTLEAGKNVEPADPCNAKPADPCNVEAANKEYEPKALAAEKRGSCVRFDVEPEKQEKVAEKITGEEEEEIEKEIEILTKRLAELRARREAKHRVQERVQRALSCPPTPFNSKPEGTPGDADKSKCRKGRIVSAKFLQWQTKSPAETEPKTTEKRAQLSRPEWSVTPIQGRGPLAAGTEAKESLQKSIRKLEITPRGPVRNKVIEKLQATAASPVRKVETRGSLEGGFVEQMRNLSLSPSSNVSSDSTYKKVDWTRSLRSNVVEKKTLPGENGDITASKLAPVKGNAEAQLLVDLKENKASKVSPAVTRKVRAVPSRYNNGESPLPLSSRKRSLDGPSQALESGGVSSHRKRASLGLVGDVSSPGFSQVRKSGLGLPKAGGQVNRLKPTVSSQLKAPVTSVQASKENREILKTPAVSSRKDRDGLLESERKKLPGLSVNRDKWDSPRDSGCVKRVSQQLLEKKEPFFRL